MSRSVIWNIMSAAVQVWCTPQRARAIVVVVCFAAAIATMPEFFDCEMMEIVEQLPGNTSTTGSWSPPVERRIELRSTEFGSSWAYSVGYRYANQALYTFVPLILLLVFNTLLISAVLTAATRRQQMAKTGREVSATSDRQDRQRRGQQRITVSVLNTLEADFQRILRLS